LGETGAFFITNALQGCDPLADEHCRLLQHLPHQAGILPCKYLQLGELPVSLEHVHQHKVDGLLVRSVVHRRDVLRSRP
jgi:hypothetical protein